MTTTAEQVYDQVLLKVRAPHLHYDLTNSVTEGEMAKPPPSKVWAAVSVFEFLGDAAAVLGPFEWDMEILVQGWVSGVTPKRRIFNAIQLASDIFNAVTEERSLGGLVHDVIPQVRALDGAHFDMPGKGMCFLSLKMKYRTNGAL